MDIKIGELKGTLTVTWMDGEKRRRFRLKAKTLAEAHAEGQRIYQREMLQRKGSFLISDCYNSYLKTVVGRPYEEDIKNHWKSIGPFFGSLRPSDISDDLVTLYIKERSAAYLKKRGKDISPTTLRHELNALRIVISHMQNRGLISGAKKFKLPSAAETDRKALKMEEIETLLSTPMPSHIYLAILVMLGTGARVSAALELTWDRVNFERNKIFLEVPSAQRSSPKAKRRATVPMSSGLASALRRQHAIAKTNHVIEYRGKPVRSVNKAFATLRKKTGIYPFSPHILRHTSAVRMILSGSHITKVAKFLGHSTSLTTEKHYAMFIPDDLQDEANALDFASADWDDDPSGDVE